MRKSISQKMGLQEGARAHFKNLPSATIDELELPNMKISSRLQGRFDYLHLFVIRQSKFTNQFLKMKNHLNPGGSLWVSWPKAGQLDSDLNIKTVIKMGYDCGLVESIALRINDTWAAIKFTFPKKGKVYKNSYGKLKTH